MIRIDRDIASFTDADACKAIASETRKIIDFWQYDSKGWAPTDVSEILGKSKLEWQSSLAKSIRIWLSGDSEGELILAWANLGALVEGLLKLFLCVYLHDYRKAEPVWTGNGQLKTPDGEILYNIQKFFADEVWSSTQKADWDPWIEHIRKRRNSIHAFKSQDLGTFDEWKKDLRIHLMFIRELNAQMPYPE